MLLSAVWTLILTAHIHCRGSVGRTDLTFRFIVKFFPPDPGQLQRELTRSGDFSSRDESVCEDFDRVSVPPFSSSTMGVADELCNALFCWIEEQEKCADHLMALANELENMREVMTAGRLVGNTATVLGSAALVGTGIATILTGGLAAPLLALTAGVTAGVGTATSLTFSLVEKWKSSETMKNAEKTTEKIKEIQKKIERLQKELQEECESQCCETSSSDDVQREITERILRAMAKRSGRYLSLSHLRHLLRSDGMSRHYRYPGFNLDAEFLGKVSCLLAILGLSAIHLAIIGQKRFTPLLEGMAAFSLKTEPMGVVQVAGGLFGLIFTVPDLIDNCEELINNKHQTQASTNLKTKSKKICEAMTELKKQLNELQEMLNQIPEVECHVDLVQEMFGSQIYTRGTICMEYKQTPKQDMRRFTQRFILLCTKDIGVTQYGSTGKETSGDNKNKRQKKATSTEDKNLNQQRKPSVHGKPPHKSKTKVKEFKIRLPKILMSNVQSIRNKIELLKKMMEDVENFNFDLIVITETWLKENSSITLKGYKAYRADRVPQLTQKKIGGGVMLLVNEAWATDVEVENIMITPDYELMEVSIIPHDHPEGAPPLTFIVVYVPGPDFTKAANDIAAFYYNALERYPGGSVFLLGDFNKCDIPNFLNLEQYVKCPTRGNKTLDKCYGNVPGAYRSECRRKIGKSDHNVIHLIPKDTSDKNDSSEDEECAHDKRRQQ